MVGPGAAVFFLAPDAAGGIDPRPDGDLDDPLSWGDEINPLAAVVWNSWSQWGDNPQAGLTGLSLYKFGIVTLVVILCEWVGRRKKKGRVCCTTL